MSRPRNPLEAILSRWTGERGDAPIRRAAEIRRARQHEERLGEIARRRYRRAKIMNLRLASETRKRRLTLRAIAVLRRPLEASPA